MPLVSVIIPAYNHAHTIERALRSVCDQTLQDFEIIVVDDASTDNTSEIVQNFADDRIQYLRHETNQFAGAARNTGMAAATGEYIAFLDSDDKWMRDKLERQVDRLEHKDQDCGCSYTGVTIKFERGLLDERVYRPEYSGDALKPYLLSKFTIWTPTFLFRRKLLETVGPFDAGLRRLEDVDFYLRMLQSTRLSCIQKPMVELFLDLGKKNAEMSHQFDLILLRKHDELIKAQGIYHSRSIYSRYSFLIGERYLQEGNIYKGMRCIARAMLWNPMHPPRRYVAALLRLFKAVLQNLKPGSSD